MKHLAACGLSEKEDCMRLVFCVWRMKFHVLEEDMEHPANDLFAS